MKVVFDMDTGVDDSLALIYALNRPAYEIQSIGCVYGNVESWLAAENTMKILDLVNAPDIPVVIGANEPLTGKWAGRVSIIHGENGLGNVELPKSERKPFDKGIEEFYLETAERLQGEMVLITVGPLTNIARTIKKYPQFVKLVKHMYMMGGTLSMRGNVSPVAEANVACDPVAADYVFQSGMKITAVGLDVTMKVRFKRAYLDWIQTHCRPELKRAAEYLGKAFEWYFMGNQDRNYCMDDSPLHDPLAVMCASVPGLVLTQTRKARVECEGQYCRGMIVTDMREHPFEAETVEFAVEVDEKKAIGELLAAFWEK